MVKTGGSGRVFPGWKNIKSSLIPKSGETYDIGTANKRWATLYVILAIMGSLVIGGAVALSTQDNTLLINSSTQIEGNLTPRNDSMFNLGQEDLRWNKFYTADDVDLSNVLIVDNSTGRVGINTTTSRNTLNVIGDGNFTNGLSVPESSAYKIDGTDIVRANLSSKSVAVGQAKANISKNWITVMGREAGYESLGDGFTAFGYRAGNKAGEKFTALGFHAGTQAGDTFTAQGYRAGYFAGSNFVAQGYYAGKNAGSDFIAQGYRAGKNAGSDFVAIGFQSSYPGVTSTPTAVNDSVAIGYKSAPLYNGHMVIQNQNLNSNPLIQGDFTSGAVGIGLTNGANLSGVSPGGMAIDGNVGIGAITPGVKLDVNGDTLLRTEADMYQSEQRFLSIGRYGRPTPLNDRHHYLTARTDYQAIGNYIAFNIDDGSTTNGSSFAKDVLSINGNGNVGIGTTSPDEKLDVNGNLTTDKLATGSNTFGNLSNGDINVSTTNSDVLKLKQTTLPICNSTTEGEIRYNGTSHYGCNGSSWNALY